MGRKGWLAGTVGLALLGSAACDRVAVAPSAPGALVVVTVDTLRADHVGAYGADPSPTPTLDRLAAEGVRFDRAFAPAPVTLPSHASLWTGALPPRHGVRHNGLFHLDDDAVTLAERLAAAGWTTGAVVGAAVLDARYGLAQGFGHYDDDVSGEESAVHGYPERRATEVTDRALAWLASVEPPFFLWVHYYDPHALYRPPPPFDERFRDRPYDGEIAYVDAEIERLWEHLAGRGLAPQTLLVVTSDHGESLGEHGEATHGYTLYDAALRVPLLVRGPDVPRGRVVRELASLVDVVPTVARLLGLGAVPAGEGRDLTGTWRAVVPDPGSPERTLYAETLATRLDHGWAPLYALRTPRRLYVRAPRPELYDLETDPGERRNLLAEGSSPKAAEASHLDRTLEELRAAEDRASPFALDPEERERLRALGYALPSTPRAYNGIDPKDGLRDLARYAEATRAFARGDYPRARELAERALPGMPESARLQGLLAGIYVRLGDSPRALPFAERAAALVPEAPEYHQLVGDVRYNVGDLEGAIAAYRAALARAPESRFVRERLAWLEQERRPGAAAPSPAGAPTGDGR